MCHLSKRKACFRLIVLITATLCIYIWFPWISNVKTGTLYWKMPFTPDKLKTITRSTTNPAHFTHERLTSSSSFQNRTIFRSSTKNLRNATVPSDKPSTILHSNPVANQNGSRGINTPTDANNTGALLQNTETNKTVYITVNLMGRLGNQMFQFASMLGTARLHGVTPALRKDSPLRHIFQIDVPDIDWKTASGFRHVGEKRHVAFNPLVGNFSTNQTMYGHYQSWRYFSNVYSELRKHFTFKKDLVNRTTARLIQLMREQHGNISLRNTTLVGVHIRRGDFTTAAKIKFGNTVGSKEYVFQAMHYFLTKYQRVMFVVCSDSIDWANKTIPHQNATFITKQTAELDMLTLSLCNHTIVTVGTYGWWAAWLAGGTTIYQIQQASPGSTLASAMDEMDGISLKRRRSGVNDFDIKKYYLHDPHHAAKERHG